MKIAFEGSNLEEVLIEIKSFVQLLNNEIEEETESTKPVKRNPRRSRTAKDTEKEPESENPKEAVEEEKAEKPKSRRSRRGKNKENKTEDKLKRGRRSGKAKSDDDDISDVDLSKAASEAAQELMSSGVRNIVDEFGVSDVKEIPTELRREFINKLKEAVADVS